MRKSKAAGLASGVCAAAKGIVARRAACRPSHWAVTGVAPQGGVSRGGARALAQAAQHPLHSDALQLLVVNGPARREGVSSAMDLRRSRAQVNFSVGRRGH